MRKYVVETALPAEAAGQCSAREWRARSAAGELRRQGVRVRFDRVIRVPEDGLCLFVFEGASEHEAARAAELARLDPFRVVEAVQSGRRAGVG
jgi:hypothetical protein